jgi:hypothetical protein
MIIPTKTLVSNKALEKDGEVPLNQSGMSQCLYPLSCVLLIRD